MSDKKTILYIDEDPASRMLVDRTLRYAGFTVLTAERGLDGIDLARSEKISLILTDIDLPDITGRELTTVLRSDKRFTKVPIVALTDLGLGEQHDLAMAAGLTGYITKPLDVEGLPQLIDNYLGGAKDEIGKTRLTKAQTQYSRELITNLEARVRELEDKNKDLVQLDQLKDTFLQVTAHELRTPLTLVYGYSRLLQDSEIVQEIVQADEGTGVLLDGLVEAVERMQRIVNEIMTMSRIMTDKFEISISPFQLKALVQKVAHRYQEAADMRNLTLTVADDGFPKSIRADADMLEIVMDNLISNAIKYTPDGGEINITATTDERCAYVSVADNGIGITEEDLHLIFERFHTASDPQLHSTSKTAFGGGGIGLGLAICRSVVEAHGGTIEAESSGTDSETNPGSTFTVKIPLNAEATKQRDIAAT